MVLLFFLVFIFTQGYSWWLMKRILQMYDCNYVIDTWIGKRFSSSHQDRWSRQVPDTCAQKLTSSFTYVSLGWPGLLVFSIRFLSGAITSQGVLFLAASCGSRPKVRDFLFIFFSWEILILIFWTNFIINLLIFLFKP